MRRSMTTAMLAALMAACTLTARATAPALSIGAASAVSTKSATFNGILTAGSNAVVTVYWGTDANDLWCSASLGAQDEGALAYTEYSLLSGQTHYYRFHAQNTDGEAWSAVQSFTTAAVTPNPRYGGGSYDGYASASTLAAIPPSATMFLIR